MMVIMTRKMPRENSESRRSLLVAYQQRDRNEEKEGEN
jgi:hypothetical protein